MWCIYVLSSILILVGTLPALDATCSDSMLVSYPTVNISANGTHAGTKANDVRMNSGKYWQGTAWIRSEITFHYSKKVRIVEIRSAKVGLSAALHVFISFTPTKEPKSMWRYYINNYARAVVSLYPSPVRLSTPLEGFAFSFIPVSFVGGMYLRLELIGCEITDNPPPAEFPTVLETDRVPLSRFQASSFKLPLNVGFWIPATTSLSEYLMIDLLVKHEIHTILSKGIIQQDVFHDVLEFKVQYIDSSGAWSTAQRVRQAFKNARKGQHMDTLLKSRYLKVTSISGCLTLCVVRLELLGRPIGCHKSSSVTNIFENDDFKVKVAPSSQLAGRTWCPTAAGAGAQLEIEFKALYVLRITTKSKTGSPKIDKFKIQYSPWNGEWITVTENGIEKIYLHDVDDTKTKDHYILPVVRATSVRIIGVDTPASACMDIEIHACRAPGCPPNYAKYDGKCYWHVAKYQLNFDDARTVCESDSWNGRGTLAMPTNPSTSQFLGALNYRSGYDALIGGYLHNGEWLMMDNSSLTWDNWKTGYPTGSDVMAVGIDVGLWVNVGRNTPKAFICEVDTVGPMARWTMTGLFTTTEKRHSIVQIQSSGSCLSRCQEIPGCKAVLFGGTQCTLLTAGKDSYDLTISITNVHYEMQGMDPNCDGDLLKEATITVSSELAGHERYYADINNVSSKTWTPIDTYPFLSVEFQNFSQVLSVTIQGDGKLNQFVTEFILMYQTDKGPWKYQNDSAGKVEKYIGNSFASIFVTHEFSEPLFTKGIALLPTLYITARSMKILIHGCTAEFNATLTAECREAVGIGSGYITDSAMESYPVSTQALDSVYSARLGQGTDPVLGTAFCPWTCLAAWLKVTFGVLQKVSGVVISGKGTKFLDKFTLEYTNPDETTSMIKDGTADKEYRLYTPYLTTEISVDIPVAKAVRIISKSILACCMKIEILGCPKVSSQLTCVFPFTYKGVQYSECTNIDNNGVPWCATTSSYDTDEKGTDCPCVKGNLVKMTVKYATGKDVTVNCTEADATSCATFCMQQNVDWIQFDMSTLHNILGFVFTYATGSSKIIKYTVRYSYDGIQWSNLTDHFPPRKVIIFDATSDSQSVSKDFPAAQTASKIRIYPTEVLGTSQICAAVKVSACKRLGCPSNFVAHRGICYGYFPTTFTQPQAQRFCERTVWNGQKGILAMPKDAFSNGFLDSFSGNLETWIGLTRNSSSSPWKWIDGSDVTWSSWYHSITGNCAYVTTFLLFFTFAKSWRIGECSASRHALCQVPEVQEIGRGSCEVEWYVREDRYVIRENVILTMSSAQMGACLAFCARDVRCNIATWSWTTCSPQKMTLSQASTAVSFTRNVFSLYCRDTSCEEPLLLAISDGSITAPNTESGFSPGMVRMNSTGWLSKSKFPNWIRFDLGSIKRISKLVIIPNDIKKYFYYEVWYISHDKFNWLLPYTYLNTDGKPYSIICVPYSSGICNVNFNPALIAKFVSLHAKSSTPFFFRAELYGCDRTGKPTESGSGISMPLGMRSGEIFDTQLLVTRITNDIRSGAPRARLDLPGDDFFTLGTYFKLVGAHSSTYVIELDLVSTITHIILQEGASGPLIAILVYVRNSSSDAYTLLANRIGIPSTVDSGARVAIPFEPAINTKIVRLHNRLYTSPYIRLEVLGRTLGCPSIPLNNIPQIGQPVKINGSNCGSADNTCIHGGPWCVKEMNDVLEIDFHRLYRVTSVILAAETNTSFTPNFQFSLNVNGYNWSDIESANVIVERSGTIHKFNFQTGPKLRILRIRPSFSEQLCLKFEIKGCPQNACPLYTLQHGRQCYWFSQYNVMPSLPSADKMCTTARWLDRYGKRACGGSADVVSLIGAIANRVHTNFSCDESDNYSTFNNWKPGTLRPADPSKPVTLLAFQWQILGASERLTCQIPAADLPADPCRYKWIVSPYGYGIDAPGKKVFTQLSVLQCLFECSKETSFYCSSVELLGSKCILRDIDIHTAQTGFIKKLSTMTLERYCTANCDVELLSSVNRTLSASNGVPEDTLTDGWNGGTGKQWWQVEFASMMKIRRISTRSSRIVNEYVLSYVFLLTNNTITWELYRHKKDSKISHLGGYLGNWVSNIVFDEPVIGRFFRIITTELTGFAVMRINMYGCGVIEKESVKATCFSELGMISGGIRETQILASSYKPGHEADHARIQRHHINESLFWEPDASDMSPWLQIDLGIKHQVTGILTQGLNSGSSTHFERYITLAAKNESGEWKTLESTTGVVEVLADLDGATVIKNRLDLPLVGRYIKIMIKRSECVGSCGLRVELLGCTADCSGLISSDIGDSQIVASTSQATCPGSNALIGRTTSGGCDAWCPLSTDTSPWLQLDLQKVYHVTGILIQDLNNETAISKFSVSHEETGVWRTGDEFVFYKTKLGEQKYPLPIRVTTTKLRIHFVEWNATMGACARVGLIACLSDACPPGFVLQNDNCYTASPMIARSRDAARKTCADYRWGPHRGHLVRVDSPIVNTLTTSLGRRFMDTSYIGAYDTGSGWKWDGDNSALTWTNWQSTSAPVSGATVVLDHTTALWRTSIERSRFTCQVQASNTNNKTSDISWYAVFNHKLTAVSPNASLQAMTRGHCLQACMKENAFLCKSASYNHVTRECLITAKQKYEHVLTSDSQWDYFEIHRNCSDKGCLQHLDQNLPDTAFTFSTSNSTAPNMVRLDASPAEMFWSPLETDNTPWLKIIFDSVVEIHTIFTKGAKSYYLAYSEDGFYYQYYGSGTKSLFGSDLWLLHQVGTLVPAIRVKSVAILPSYVKPVRLTVAFYGFPISAYITGGELGRDYSVGMTSGDVMDSQISAAPAKPGYPAFRARLNDLGWCSVTNAVGPNWLDINLLVTYTLIGIATDGSAEDASFVSQFGLAYMEADITFQDYKHSGTNVVFKGNFAGGLPVKNLITPSLHAKVIRIKPTKYTKNVHMKVELFGYSEVCPAVQILKDSPVCSGVQIYKVSACENETAFKSFTSTKPGCTAWCIPDIESNPWVKVDLGTLYHLSAISTHRPNLAAANLTGISLQLSTDHSTWTIIQSLNVSSEIVNNITVQLFRLRYVKTARYVKIMPKEWTAGDRCVTFDVNACRTKRCPAGFIENERKCYWPVNTRQDFNSSRAQCEKYQWTTTGRVAIPNSPQAYDAIYDVIAAYKAKVWVGAYMNSQGSYIQLDGARTELSFAEWESAATKNETCLVWNQKLSDVSCAAKHYVVCEVEPAAVLKNEQEPKLSWDLMPNFLQTPLTTIFSTEASDSSACMLACAEHSSCKAAILIVMLNMCYLTSRSLADGVSLTTLSERYIFEKYTDECADRLIEGDQGVTFTASDSSTDHITLSDLSTFWSPAGAGSWFKVKFSGKRSLLGIITQGTVTQYTLSYYYENVWHPIVDTNGQTRNFRGSVDQSSYWTNRFGSVIETRKLKLTTVSSSSTYKLKMELIGCPSKSNGFVDCFDNVGDVLELSLPGVPKTVRVQCQEEWTVILKRDINDNRTSFTQTFVTYEHGFGFDTENYWMGLIAMNFLTSKRRYKLRIDMFDLDDTYLYAEFETFKVYGKDQQYKVNVGNFIRGNGTDGFLIDHIHNRPFTVSIGMCAIHRYGWWFHPLCKGSKLTGIYTRRTDPIYFSWMHRTSGKVFLSKAVMRIMPYYDSSYDCKITQLGKEYRGKLRMTSSGVSCSQWEARSQTMDANLFPGKNLRDSENYCRNPDGRNGGPWCYTSYTQDTWENCSVSVCTDTYGLPISGNTIWTGVAEEANSNQCAFNAVAAQVQKRMMLDLKVPYIVTNIELGAYCNAVLMKIGSNDSSDVKTCVDGPSDGSVYYNNVRCSEFVTGQFVYIEATGAGNISNCDARVKGFRVHELGEPCGWDTDCMGPHSHCTLDRHTSQYMCLCEPGYARVGNYCVTVSNIKVTQFSVSATTASLIRDVPVKVTVNIAVKNPSLIPIDAALGTRSNFKIELFLSNQEMTNASNKVHINTHSNSDGILAENTKQLIFAVNVTVPPYRCREFIYLCAEVKEGDDANFIAYIKSGSYRCIDIKSLTECAPEIDLSVTEIDLSQVEHIVRNTPQIHKLKLNISQMTGPYSVHEVNESNSNFILEAFLSDSLTRNVLLGAPNVTINFTDQAQAQSELGNTPLQAAVQLSVNMPFTVCKQTQFLCISVKEGVNASFRDKTHTYNNTLCQHTANKINCRADADVVLSTVSLAVPELVRGYPFSVALNVSLTAKSGYAPIESTVLPDVNYNVMTMFSSVDLASGAINSLSASDVHLSLPFLDLSRPSLENDALNLSGIINYSIPRDGCSDYAFICINVTASNGSSYKEINPVDNVKCLDLVSILNCKGKPITGLKTGCDPAIAFVNSNVHCNVSWDAGSDVNVEVDFRDGNTYRWDWKEQNHTEHYGPFSFNISHNFTAYADVTILAKGKNEIGEEVGSVSVSIEPNLTKVLDISVEYTPSHPPVSLNLWFRNRDGDLANSFFVFSNISFGDSVIVPYNDLLSSPKQHTHVYTNPSQPEAFLEIFAKNHFSEMSFSTTVILQQEIDGLIMKIDRTCVETFTPVLFDLSMAKGSHTSFRVDFGGEFSVTLTHPNTRSASSPTQLNHTFTTPGIYAVSVTASNKYYNQTAQLTSTAVHSIADVCSYCIVVQHSIRGFTLSATPKWYAIPSPPAEWTIQQDDVFPVPTNTSCILRNDKIMLQNISIDDSFSLSRSTKITHTFQKSDIVKEGSIDIICMNCANEHLFALNATVYEKINGFFLQIKPSIGRLDQTYTVVLNVTAGSHVTFDVDKGEGNRVNYTHPSLFASSQPYSFTISYQKPGNYTFDVNASNPATSSRLSEMIIVQRSVESLILQVDMFVLWPPGVQNVTIYNSKGQGRLEDVHCVFEFGDGNIEYVYISVIDENNTFFRPHYYQKSSIGKVSFTANCSNLVSYKVFSREILIEYDQVLLKSLDCNQTVFLGSFSGFVLRVRRFGTGSCFTWDMGDGNRFVYGVPHCDREAQRTSAQYIQIPDGTLSITVNHKYQALGGYTITVFADNYVTNHTLSVRTAVLSNISCYYPEVVMPQKGRTRDNPFVFHRSDYFNIVPVTLIPHCNITERSVWSWKAYRSVGFLTGEQLLSQRGNLEFIHPSMSLPIGLFELRLNVTMYNVNGCETVKTVFLRMIISRLVAGIVGGDERTVSMNRSVQMNAFTESFDPELPDRNRSGIMFSWFCRYLKGQIPNITSGGDKMQKCYGNVFNYMNISDGEFGMNTTNIHVYNTFEFLVEVSKDSRQSRYAQIFHVSESDTPELKIICRQNCLGKVRYAANLVLRVECVNYCEPTMSYLWRLYVVRKNTKEYSEMEIKASMTLTGVTEKSIFLKAFSLTEGLPYQFVVEANAPNSPKSKAKYKFLMNKRPFGGKCDLNHEKGTAIQTNFQIVCYDWREWHKLDPDALFSYEYRIRPKGSSSDASLIHYGNIQESTPTSYPLGNHTNNFLSQLELSIIDSVGDVWIVTKDVEVSVPQLTFEQFFSMLREQIIAGNSTLSALLKNGEFNLLGNQLLVFMSLLYAEPNPFVDSSGDKDKAAADIENLIKLRREVKPYMANMLKMFPSTTVQEIDMKNGLLQMNLEFPDLVDVSTQLLTLESVEGMWLYFQVNKLNFTIEEQTIYLTHLLRTGYVLQSVSSSFLKTVKLLSEVHLIWLDPAVSSLKKILNITWGYAGMKNFIGSPSGKLVLPVMSSIHKFSTEAQTMLIDNMMFRDPSLELHFKTVSLFLSKGDHSQLHNNSYSCVHGDMSMPGVVNTSEKMDCVEKRLVISAVNPFLADESANDVDSSIVSFSLVPCRKTPNSNNAASSSSRRKKRALTDPHLITPYTVNLKIQDPPLPYNVNETTRNNRHMIYHNFSIGDEIVPWLIEVQPTNESDYAHVYIDIGDEPTLTSYTWQYTLPRNQSDVSQELGGLHSIYLPAHNLTNGTYKVGVRTSESPSHLDYTSETFPKLMTYSVYISELSCRQWDAKGKKWIESCKVQRGTTPKKSVFRSNLFGSFGTGLLVMPNTIDFGTLFLDFDKKLAESAAVLATIAVVLVAYALLAVYMRRVDKANFYKWMSMPLMDNIEGDRCQYDIYVYTGFMKNAETESNISFILHGINADTGIRRLRDGERKNFGRGEVNPFVLKTAAPLGNLKYLRIWHDNSGKGNKASWYISKFIVVDTATKLVYICNAEQWLAEDEDDGRIDRTFLFRRKIDKEAEAGSLLQRNFRRNLVQDHLWVSLLSQKSRSSFTRLQRLSCCLSILFLTMITNAMFYRSEEEGEQTTNVLFQIGPVTFTWYSIFTSLASSVIVVPPVLLMTTLFVKSKEKPSDSKIRRMFGENDLLDEGRILPHWCIGFGWMLVFLSVAVSCTFTIFYSASWGRVKSTAWLTSFLLSFIQSIFLVQPVKVVMMAVLITFVWKRDTDMDAYRKLLRHKEDTYSEADMDDVELLAVAQDPADELRREEIHAQREVRRKMADMIKEFLVIILFLFLMIMLSNDNLEIWGYHSNEYLKKTFNANGKISNPESVLTWMTDEGIHMLYNLHSHNGETVSDYDQKFMVNQYSMRLGPPRLRQLRVISKPCRRNLVMKPLIKRCAHSYSSAYEDTQSHTVGWLTPLQNSSYVGTALEQSFVYRTKDDLRGTWTWGKLHWYSPGGYVANLGKTKSEALLLVRNLNAANWLNRHTRAVLLEVNLYNANINLFSLLTVIMEFPTTGGAIVWQSIQTVGLYRYAGVGGTLSLALEILTVLFILILLIREIKNAVKQGWQYFTNFWHILMWFILAIALAGFGCYIYRSILTASTVEEMMNNSGKSVNFQPIAFWNDLYLKLLGFATFFLQLYLLYVLRYSKTIAEMLATIQHAAAEVACAGFSIGLILVAFCSLAYLLFGRRIGDYSDMVSSGFTLLNTLLNKFDFQSLSVGEGLLGRLFFLAFVCVSNFVFLNLFITILTTIMAEVKAGALPVDADFLVMEYAIDTFVSLLPGRQQKKKKSDELNIAGEVPIDIPENTS